MYQAVKKEQNAWHLAKIYSKGEGEDQGGKGKNNICEDDQVRSKQKAFSLQTFPQDPFLLITVHSSDRKGDNFPSLSL